MKSFIVRLGAFALALYLTATLVDGIYFDSIAAVIMAAVVLSVLNAILRPILILLTLPVNILTLGLFTFVVNGLMLKITSFLVPDMAVSGFWTATLGALILTVISSIITWVVSE